jgi:hypothetical protein
MENILINKATLKISNSTNQLTKYMKADLESEGILTFHGTESFITVFTSAGMFMEMLDPSQSQTGGPSLVSCPRLHIQYKRFCIACNETNLMHYLSSFYSVTTPLHVSGLLVTHHLEMIIYICDNWYMLYILVDCQWAWLESNIPFQPGLPTVN